VTGAKTEMKPAPTRVFIYGSCVSRDTFEYLPDSFELSYYVARQSLISVGAPADPMLLDGARLESPFQQRMLEEDVRGSVFEWLEHPRKPEPDVLLWDLTDERRGVYLVGDGAVTVSDEAQAAGVLSRLRERGRHVPFGSGEHLALWTAALHGFLDRLADTPVRHLILLAPAWAERTVAGDPTPPSAGMSAVDALAALAPYYAAVERTGRVEVVTVDDVLADDSHRWGAAPFHYAPDVYARLSDAIVRATRYATSGGGPPGDAISARAVSHAFGRHLDSAGDDDAVAMSLLTGSLRIPPHGVYSLGREIDWQADPFSDRNWCFNLHTLRWADVLRRVGAKGYSRYAEGHKAVLRSWIDTHAGTSAHPPSKFSWNDMATGLRALVFTAAISTYGPEKWLLEALAEHGEVLADPAFGSRRGNHALHMKIGLLVAGDVLDRNDWVNAAEDGIRWLVEDGVHDDGADAEGAVSYHATNLRWYSEAARRLELAGRGSPSWVERVTAMTELLAHATTPAGTVVPLGDSDTRAPQTFGDARIEFARSRGERGNAPAATRALFPKGGYLFSRTAWHRDAAFYSLKFGPSRRSQHHGHDDGGSVTYAVGDRTLLFDSGRHKYDQSPLSRYFKTRDAHNSLVLEADPYAGDSPTELVGADHNEDYEWTVVRRSETHGSVWYRGVYFSRESGALVVVDDVRPAVPGPWAQHWQLSEAATVNRTRSGAQAEHPDGVVLDIRTSRGPLLGTEVVAGREAPFLGWRSYGYGGAFAAPVLRIVHPGGRGYVVTAFTVSDRVGTATASALIRAGADATRVVLPARAGAEALTITIDDSNGPMMTSQITR